MGGRRGNPRVQCSICTAESRARAELLLAKGDGYSATAKRLALSPDALERHWKRHVTAEQKEALAPGGRALIAREGLIADVAEQASTVLDNLKAEHAGLWRLFVAELQSGQSTKAAIVAAQLTKALDLMARLTGQLSSSPLLQQNNFYGRHFTQDPEFLALMAQVAEVLGPYPDARRAVMATFARLDQREQSGALDGQVIEVPQLEHHEQTQA